MTYGSFPVMGANSHKGQTPISGMWELPTVLFGRSGRGESDVSICSARSCGCSCSVAAISHFALCWNRRNWSEGRRDGQGAERGRTTLCCELRSLPPAANEHFAQNDRDDHYAYAHARSPFPRRL